MKYYFWVFAFFVVTYLAALGIRPMVVPDEFRYAQIPLEMIHNNNFVSPTLLGVDYFEKPVLGYWLTVGSFQLFGVNAFADRLPAALGAGLTALLIALLMEQLFRDRKTGALAAVIYLSFGLVYGVGTFAVMDSQLTAFVTGISFCLFLAILEPSFTKRKFALLVLAGIFMALALMTKGFLAFAVPGLAIAGFLAWEKRWKEFLILPWIPLVTALLLIAPWALAIHEQAPDFWRYFTVVEHWERFTADNSSQHPEPFWYFIPVLAGGIMPSGLLVILAYLGGKGKFKVLFDSSLMRFCLSALILPFIFFSACSGKLATYILPCLPPLAIMMAILVRGYFHTGNEYKGFSRLMSIYGIVLMIAAAGGTVFVLCYSRLPFTLPFVLPVKPVLITAAGLFVYGALLAYGYYLSWRGRLGIFFAGISISAVPGSFVLQPEMLNGKAPERMLETAAKTFAIDPQKDILVTHPTLMHAVAYVYRQPDIKLYKRTGELKYGIDAARNAGQASPLIDQKMLAQLIQSRDRGNLYYIERNTTKEEFEQDFRNDFKQDIVLTPDRYLLLDNIIIVKFPVGKE